MTKNKTEATIQDNKVIYKRYFDVPVDLAFEVWTSHEHLSQWFGPDGFTISTKSLNFTNGGIWDFVMHGPDGQDYKNKIQFTEIKRPDHLFYRHLGDGEGEPDVHFETKVYFQQSGDGTNFTMEQIFPSKEELERINKKYGAIEGGKQNVDKLGRYVESLRH